MKKDLTYRLAKNGGKLYRDHLEPSAFKGAPAIIDKIGSRITDPMFHNTTYGIVGTLGYKRGSNPALGSVAYTGIHTLLKILFCWVFIIGGAGKWLLKGVWSMAKFVLPLVGKLFLGVLKLFGLGFVKIFGAIIGLIFK